MGQKSEDVKSSKAKKLKEIFLQNSTSAVQSTQQSKSVITHSPFPLTHRTFLRVGSAHVGGAKLLYRPSHIQPRSEEASKMRVNLISFPMKDSGVPSEKKCECYFHVGILPY